MTGLGMQLPALDASSCPIPLILSAHLFLQPLLLVRGFYGHFTPRVFTPLLSSYPHVPNWPCTCTGLEGWGTWQPGSMAVPVQGLAEEGLVVCEEAFPPCREAVHRCSTQLFRVFWVDRLPVTHSGDPLTFLHSVLIFAFPIPISWFCPPLHYLHIGFICIRALTLGFIFWNNPG